MNVAQKVVKGATLILQTLSYITDLPTWRSCQSCSPCKCLLVPTPLVIQHRNSRVYGEKITPKLVNSDDLISSIAHYNFIIIVIIHKFGIFAALPVLQFSQYLLSRQPERLENLVLEC